MAPTPQTHAPLPQRAVRRQHPRQEPSALTRTLGSARGAARKGGPYRDPGPDGTSACAARVQRSARAVHQRLTRATRDLERPPDLRVRAVLELMHDQRAALARRQILEIRDQARNGLAAREDRNGAAARIRYAEVFVGEGNRALRPAQLVERAV